MNDVLLARHKLFEDKRLNDAFEKLFPANASDIPKSSCNAQADREVQSPSTSSLDDLVQVELLNSIRNSDTPQIDSLIQLEILKIFEFH